MTDTAPASTIGFGGLDIAYDERVLTPRPWTLAQSHWAADLLRTAPPGPVLEVCAGVGHLGLVATAGSERELVLVDLNPAACTLARANADAAGAGGRVEVREGGMADVLADDERFALIVADPPWVESARVGTFPDDPLIAIDGGADGLDLARACCRVVHDHLSPGGAAVLQLGSTEQAERVSTYLADLPSDVRVGEVRTFERGVLVLLHRDR